MKIMFFIDSLGIGGKEKRCLQVANYLNSLGNHEVMIITFDDLFINFHELNDSISIYSLNRKHSKDLNVAFKLFRIIKNYKPDTVVSWSLMSTFWINFLSFFLRFRYISAYVANCNKPKTYSIGNIARIGSFLCSSAIVGNSKFGLETYKIPKKKACLIYNGYNFVNISMTKKKDVRAELRIQTTYIVSMIARISEAKDYQTYLNIAKTVIQNRSDITFLAIGGGPLLEYYKSQITDNESGYILFTGERNDIENFYDITDISVLCSPSEGISNFLLESMAHSIPVVATNTGGTPEIVIHDYNGFLVDHKNEVGYIKYITELLEDQSLRNKLGMNAYQSVSTKFDINLMGAQFNRLINK